MKISNSCFEALLALKRFGDLESAAQHLNLSSHELIKLINELEKQIGIQLIKQTRSDDHSDN